MDENTAQGMEADKAQSVNEAIDSVLDSDVDFTVQENADRAHRALDELEGADSTVGVDLDEFGELPGDDSQDDDADTAEAESPTAPDAEPEPDADDVSESEEVVLTRKQYERLLAESDAQIAAGAQSPADVSADSVELSEGTQRALPDAIHVPEVPPFEISDDEADRMFAHGDRNTFASVMNRYGERVAAQTTQAVIQSMSPVVYRQVAETMEMMEVSKQFFADPENQWLADHPQAFNAAAIKLKQQNPNIPFKDLLAEAKTAIAHRKAQFRKIQGGKAQKRDVRDTGQPLQNINQAARSRRNAAYKKFDEDPELDADLRMAAWQD